MSTTLPKVFISYRRNDSLAATGRLYDRLNTAYPGMFFRDVSGIGVGVDFTREIERAVASSVALVAVIGPGWATESADGRRRLDDPGDFVRLEVSSALHRGIRIIPVLVGGASMPEEDVLPEDLRALRKWNAIQLVEEYYEAGLERLIDALRPQLGEPRTSGAADRLGDERKLRDLRGEAEAALAVDDWLAGIQALQAAVSLDPNDRELAARLRWAHEQHKVSGLFAEGQQLYDHGRKAQALARFRQVRVAAGDYRNVGDLIRQLEGEVAQEHRRSRVRRWTAGTAAALVITVVGAGALVIWVIRSEFADANDSTFDLSSLVDPGIAVGGPLDGGTSAPSGAPATPASGQPQRVPDAAPAQQPRAGVGFPGLGRWRMTSRTDQSVSLLLALERDGSFAVAMPAGVLNLPLSGGRYTYDDSTGVLQVVGMNSLDAFFSEAIHVFEREDDHFHANYAGSVWELVAAD